MIKFYVLNDFLKFERKLYSLFGIKLGRTISFKTITYVVAFSVLMFILLQLPIIGSLIGSLPPMFILALVIGPAVLLTDVGTENRPPLNALASFIRYHWLSLKKESYYKGKVANVPRAVRFKRIATVREPLPQPINEPQGIRFKRGVTYK